MTKVTVKNILKNSVIVFGAVFVVLLVLLAAAPSIISNRSVQGMLTRQLSRSLQRQVSWSNLAVSWLDGLTLTGLKLGNGPAPLLTAAIERITLVPSMGNGLDGRFGIDLQIGIRTVQAELAPGPPQPKAPVTKDPFTQLAESIQRLQNLDLPLPVDLRIQAEVAPLNLSYRAHPADQPLLLDNFAFHFTTPSLATQPVTATLSGKLSASGHALGEVGCSATITDLVTRERRIRLAPALFAVNVSAPGTRLTLSGGLRHVDGFTVDAALNLPRLVAVAAPFLSPALPKLNGDLKLQLRATGDDQNNLHGTVRLDGTALSATGGRLKSARVGPMNLTLQQGIATDAAHQRVEFPAGTLGIPGIIDLAWHAAVARPTLPERSLDLQLGPMKLDLARTLQLLAPLLPPRTPQLDVTGELALRSLALHLHGAEQRGDLTLSGLGVTVARLQLKQGGRELTGADLFVAIDSLSSPLVAGRPTAATAELLWGVGRAALSGTQPLSVSGGKGRVALSVTDLNLHSASPRKVAAAVSVTQLLDIERISVSGRLNMEKLHEQLRLTARGTEKGDLTADLPELSVSVAALQGTAAGKRLAALPLSFMVNAAGMALSPQPGGRPTVQHAAAVVTAGDFLRLSTDAALSGASPQHASTSGTARIDLGRLLPFAAPLAPAGVRGDGVVTLSWKMAAPLPEKPFQADQNPLRSGRAALALLDAVDLTMKLDNVSATLPTQKGSIAISGLQSSPALHVVATGKDAMVRFDGGLLFSVLGGVPGSTGTIPSQHGSFRLSAALNGWREFRLSEELNMAPMMIAQEGELNVNRIDSLLDEKAPFSRATVLKRLDATLVTSVEGTFTDALKQLLPGVELKGRASGSLRADLSGGRDLAVAGAITSDNFGARLANGTVLEGVRSDISINRLYGLATASAAERWSPLSAALVRPSAPSAANPGSVDIVGRISSDLRGDLRGGRSFSITRLVTKMSGVPLELGAIEGDLLFSPEQSGLSYFQADLLGGTLQAHGVVDLGPEIPLFSASSSFSNLDISRLSAVTAPSPSGNRDAELSGEIAFTAPVTPEQRELTEQLRLALNVRKIGSSTIERALFSLDPYERNEQIVAQRKMLRLGGLKGLRIAAVDGALSMEGEAQVKGVPLALPRVERLRISELPLRRELQANRGSILSLRSLLELLRADTLVIGPAGDVLLKRRNHEQ